MIIYGFTGLGSGPATYGTSMEARDRVASRFPGVTLWQYEIPESIVNPVDNPLPTKHGTHIKATMKYGHSEELVLLLEHTAGYPWVGVGTNYAASDIVSWEPIQYFSDEDLAQAIFDEVGIPLDDDQIESIRAKLFK